MEEVKFEGDNYVKEIEVEKTSNILTWVMKLSGGTIQSEQAAGWVVVGLVVIALLVAFFVIPRAPGVLPDENMHTTKDGGVYYPNVKNR